MLLGVSNVAVPYMVKQREATAEFYGLVGEQLAGREDLRANGGLGYARLRFIDLLRILYRRTRDANFRGYSLWLSATAAIGLGNAMTFLLGAYFWRRGLMTIGTVYLVFHYIQLLGQPLEEIRSHLQELQRATAGISRIAELRALRPTVFDGKERRCRRGHLRYRSLTSASPMKATIACSRTSPSASRRALFSACSGGPAAARRL
jgi:ABC-type multidrug transport system fused ATPase/permease subunit